MLGKKSKILIIILIFIIIFNFSCPTVYAEESSTSIPGIDFGLRSVY